MVLDLKRVSLRDPSEYKVMTLWHKKNDGLCSKNKLVCSTKRVFTQHVQGVRVDKTVSRVCYEECQPQSAVLKYMLVWKGFPFQESTQFLKQGQRMAITPRK
jgi:hypothetical protein